MSTDVTTPESDIDAIMSLAAPVTDDTAAEGTETGTDADTSETAENGTETPAEGSTSGSPAPLYPNVFATFKVGVDAPADGANPEGTLTVSEFVGHLTITAFQEAAKEGKAVTPDLIVKDPAIYNGTKSTRHPLPVVLVFPADSDEQKDAKVFLPIAEATEAYRTRPERGTGTAASSASKRTFDSILEDAAKKYNAQQAIVERLKRATEQYEASQKLMAKYAGWLRPFRKDDENPDESVQEAIKARAAELEEAAALAADAAKNADIADKPADAPANA